MDRLNDIVPLKELAMFSEKELQYIISGSQDYDMVCFALHVPSSLHLHLFWIGRLEALHRVQRLHGDEPDRRVVLAGD